MVTLLALPMASCVLMVAMAMFGENGWAITYGDSVTTDGIVVVVTQ